MAIRAAQTSPSEKLRIIVLGYVVRGPLGGMVWSNLHFLMGLARLGHEVYFLEDSDDFPSCYDPSKGYTDVDPSYGLTFAAAAFARISFAERWGYYDAHRALWCGPLAPRAIALCHEADLVLNLCGVNPLRPWLREIPHRALVDEDPAFTQIRHLTDNERRDFAVQHNVFFSFGENIASGRCKIPDDGLPWQAARQPVVLDALPVAPGKPHAPFTTVMQWESYPGHDYNGQHYGMKSEAFSPYLQLPSRTGAHFEIAVGGAEADRTLRQNGWQVRDPFKVSRSPSTYEEFLRSSKGEFSVAKHGYVVSRSGWFSERSAAYLATGRPVVIQETGFSDWLAAGAGVLAFNTPDEALAGIAAVNSRYDFHCRAAREIAEEYFDARKVLPPLLARAMSSATVAHGSR